MSRATDPEFSQSSARLPQDWECARSISRARGMALGPGRAAAVRGRVRESELSDRDRRAARRSCAGRRTGRCRPGPTTWRANTASSRRCGRPIRWRPEACSSATIPSVLGAPFQIIEYRPGIVIRDTLPPELGRSAEVGASAEPATSREPCRVACRRPGAGSAWRRSAVLSGFLARTVEGWAARAAARRRSDQSACCLPRRSPGCAAGCPRIGRQASSIPTSSSTI